MLDRLNTKGVVGNRYSDFDNDKEGRNDGDGKRRLRCRHCCIRWIEQWQISQIGVT